MNNWEYKKIIVIGTTDIYHKICVCLREHMDKFQCTFYECDNDNRKIYCNVKDNVSQDFVSDVKTELSNIQEPALVINCGCLYISKRNC